jgi:sulfite exporter TauE/SafE/copper chaperone CopZ/plastocyanin
MMKKLEIQILGIKSFNDKLKLETEIDVLEGVKETTVNEKTGTLLVEFDDALISKDKILKKIKELGYKIKVISSFESSLQEFVYYVKGMHCASCELLIEKELLKIKNIKSVEASVSKGTVRIIYQGERPKVQRLNSIFKKQGYTFFEEPIKREKGNHLLTVIGSAFLVIVLFFLLKNSRFAGLVNVNSNSSLPTFFLLGLIAGVSSCAALVGGLLLSMAKQWSEIYSKSSSTLTKLQPYLLFNFGRLLSYGIFGGIIGAIGAKIQFSLSFSAYLILHVSLLMIFLGLQMLGVRYFSRFQITVPKFIIRKIADETKFQGKLMPFLMGALTFFLPCGFTLTSQSLALISGSFWQGAAIMFFFALGTVPGLLAIGFSSVKFLEKPHFSDKFLKVAGILVLFFALYNINAQLNLLGLPSLSDVKFNYAKQVNSPNNSFDEKDLPPIINGKQVIRMKASSNGYQPNYFKVRVGIPVRWEIEDVGTSGCTNAIVAKDLFPDEIPLTPGKVSVKEFTPTKPGKYKFSCWMGMISGIIEVVDGKSATKNSDIRVQALNTNNNDVIPSGAKGCGCGGSGGSCGAR